MLSKFIQKRAFSHAELASKHAPGVSYPLRNKLFINGQWQDAKSGQTFDVINPATEELITKVASGGPEDIELAVQAAKQAGPIWGSLPPFVRASMMNKFADKIEQHIDELATIESDDNGKPYEEAARDAGFSAMLIRYFASVGMTKEGKAMMRDNMGPFQNSYIYTRHEPIGVCGLITPWNYPMLMTANKLAPMLAAGCAGISKPPELACLSSLRMIELWHEVEGVMPGVLNCVPGVGAEAGEALVDHPDVPKISFTGSTAIGKRIMERGAKHLKRVTLELGGKGPLVVFADCDMEKALGTACMFSMVNSGQMCGASTRMVIEESIHDEFVERLSQMISSLKFGNWRDGDFEKGPVISEGQMNKILGYIESGKEQGARLVCGGKRMDRPGYFVEPTLFADCNSDMRIVQEEIFGPVCSVLKFKSGEGSVEDAIRVANDTKYGLVGGVFTNDRTKMNTVIRHMKCGMVGNNTYWGTFYESPFGGFKESGIGREFGADTINNYLEPKTVVVDCSTP